MTPHPVAATPSLTPLHPCLLLLPLQEEEARLKPGTLKSLAFAVMKARGVTAPVSADDIVRITTTDGTRIDWPDKTRRTLASVSSAATWACCCG
jgi:hypothetical protein